MVKNKNSVIAKAVVIGLFFYLISKRSKAMSNQNIESELTPDNIRNSLAIIKQRHGREIAKRVEQLYRKETRHFQSGQFKGTLSPGMEPSPQTNSVFPFGWNSLKLFAQQNNIGSGSFFLAGPYTEGGTGRQKKFIGFPDLVTAMEFLIFMINRRGGNWGKWYSLNESDATRYQNSLNQISTPIVNSL
jgi:hypothetical protein